MPNLFRSLLLLAALLLALIIAGWMALTTNAALQTQPTTVTPTKPAVRNEITFPEPETVAYGFMRIQGTALIDDFQRYQVHIASSGSENWQGLVGSFNVVRDGDLYVLDTSQFPDGFYDLRVRAIAQSGQYTESFVRGFEIRNENPPTPTPTPSITVTMEITGTPTLPPLSPLQTPSLLPTPTPTPESFIPGGQGIYVPTKGAILSGSVRIVGTANAPDPYHRFQRYELYLSPSGQEEWQWIFSSQIQLYNDTLYILDTTKLSNGFYDLRLRIVYRDSNYDQYHVRNLRVDNDARITDNPAPVIRITTPRENSRISGIVDIVGTIAHPQLQRWELYWAEDAPANQEWQYLYRGDYQVFEDLIARIDLSQVPTGTYTLRLRVVQLDGNYEDYIIRRLHVARPTSGS